MPAPARHAALPMVDRLAHRPGSSFLFCVCVTVCASASFACSGSIVHAEGASRPCWRSRARARRPGPSAWRLRPPPAAGLGLWGLLAACARSIVACSTCAPSPACLLAPIIVVSSPAGRPYVQCSRALQVYNTASSWKGVEEGSSVAVAGRSPTGGVRAEGELQVRKKLNKTRRLHVLPSTN